MDDSKVKLGDWPQAIWAIATSLLFSSAEGRNPDAILAKLCFTMSVLQPQSKASPCLHVCIAAADSVPDFTSSRRRETH